MSSRPSAVGWRITCRTSGRLASARTAASVCSGVANAREVEHDEQSCHGTRGLCQGMERGTLDNVPEGMNVDLAHKLTEREAQEAKERRRWQELAEIGEVIILAI